tara:strand:- start:2442 stop:2819 length:378 start_codon:yes stop_codon:yes gene_type:complete
VKEKLNIKSILTILPFWGLAVLLLLSPCKVRSFIQGELDIPQTEVVNKSQTTISNTNCNDISVVSSTLLKEKSFTQHFPASVAEADLAFTVFNFPNNYIQSHIARNHSASAVPLYILYQSFTDYL